MKTFSQFLKEGAMVTDDFKKLGVWLNTILLPYNYQVAPAAAAGKPGKVLRSSREYRLQLINKNNDTSQQLINGLKQILLKASSDINGIVFNPISPNSSKFPSYSFIFNTQHFDLVIGRGANKGENFETNTVANLAGAFNTTKRDPAFATLINLLNKANPEFASVEIVSVKQRTGSTKKEGVPIEKLGAIIGDIVMKDRSGQEWFISLKDMNGNTFSSYSGASSLFNSAGDLQPKSAGADFLYAFGVDLNKVQAGFDQRNKITTPRNLVPVKNANQSNLKDIFERAWGMNYFYVKRIGVGGWKVFWLDREKLNKLAGNIRVTDIRYPSNKSKQVTILCESPDEAYTVELRNSKAGEYPNDIKIKVR